MAQDPSQNQTAAAHYYATNAEAIRPVREGMAEAVKGFGTLHHAVMKPGELQTLHKELIALGISVAVRCEPCIYAHIQASLKAGATRGQILETAAVGMMMAGGPGYTYLPRVTEALEALGVE